MNYDQPRQLKDGSGFHYTRMNDDEVWALGYCREHLDQPHATEDEARECYTRYQLDKELHLEGSYAEARYRCEAILDGKRCGMWTDRFAEIGPWGPHFTLCDEHRTREQFADLFGTAGDSAHS